MMQYFKSNGYKTIGGGKIFHGNNKPGDSLSWDEYFVSKENTSQSGRDKTYPKFQQVLDGLIGGQLMLKMIKCKMLKQLIG